jgi:hypothetical protein
MKLRELLEVYNDYPQAIDLYHVDEYGTRQTRYRMTSLTLQDFTAEGLIAFADVLDAEVLAVKAMATYQNEVYIKGCSILQAENLSAIRAGHINADTYRLLFNDAEDEEQ